MAQRDPYGLRRCQLLNLPRRFIRYLYNQINQVAFPATKLFIHAQTRLIEYAVLYQMLNDADRVIMVLWSNCLSDRKEDGREAKPAIRLLQSLFGGLIPIEFARQWTIITSTLCVLYSESF